MVLNAAYLLPEGGETELRRAVEESTEGTCASNWRPVGALLVRDLGRNVTMTLAAQRDELALVDLLDRLLAGGVVLTGDVTISLAGVDLVHVSLRALISSVSTLAEP